MDGRQTGCGNLKLGSCMRGYPDSLSVGWFHGGLCHRQDEMEAVGRCDDLFFDGYDDSGSLYLDSGVYQIFQDAFDEQSDWSDTAISDIVASDYDLYYDRVFPESA